MKDAHRRRPVEVQSLCQHGEQKRFASSGGVGRRKLQNMGAVVLLSGVACLVGSFTILQELEWQRLRQPQTETRLESGYAVVDPQSCGNEEQRVHRVFEWAKQNGAYIHPNVSIGSFPLSSFPGAPPGTPDIEVRGLRANGSVAEGQVMFGMTEESMLHIGKLASHHWLAPLYKMVPQFRDDIGGLAVLLLTEALNRSSSYRAYLCSLPELVPLPIFYSESEYAQAKAALPLDQRQRFDALTEARRDLIQLHYMYLMPVLYRDYPHLFPPTAYTFKRFEWAVSIILSRTWGLKMDTEPATRATDAGRPMTGVKHARNKSTVHALLPAADMPNHIAAGAEAERDPSGTLILRQRQNTTAGQQIFISYGSKCDAEFLAHYGFRPLNNAHVACKRASRSATAQAPEAGTREDAGKWRIMWRRAFAIFLRKLYLVRQLDDESKRAQRMQRLMTEVEATSLQKSAAKVVEREGMRVGVVA